MNCRLDDELWDAAIEVAGLEAAQATLDAIGCPIPASARAWLREALAATAENPLSASSAADLADRVSSFDATAGANIRRLRFNELPFVSDPDVVAWTPVFDWLVASPSHRGLPAAVVTMHSLALRHLGQAGLDVTYPPPPPGTPDRVIFERGADLTVSALDWLAPLRSQHAVRELWVESAERLGQSAVDEVVEWARSLYRTGRFGTVFLPEIRVPHWVPSDL